MTEKSNDPKVVANFIVNYPSHPKTPEFRRKLARLGSSSSSAQTSTSHQSNNHRSAYVTIKNLSKCPIVVNFTGKSSYNISVPANSTGRMSLNKGSYTISSVICGGKYHQSKTINADYQLTLGVR